MQDLVVENPRVVKPTPLVSTSTTKNDDIYSKGTADRTAALFPRAVGQYRVVLLEKVVVLAPPFKKRSVVIDRLDDLLMRVSGAIKVFQGGQTASFHLA